MTSHDALLRTLETYYDEAPRASATTEEIGPFTLFLQRHAGSWPYYARPRLDGPGTFSAADVERVRARQRELGVPESFEWVEENAPGLGEALEATGLTVHAYPLLVLGSRLRDAPPPHGVRVEVLDEDHPALAGVNAAVGAAFGETDDVEAPREESVRRDLVAEGLLRVVGAFDEDGPVGGGSHAPRGPVTELVGIGVLPRARQGGIGAAVTAALVADARARGAGTVFLSAGSDRVAAIYERVGFERVGTAGIAESSEA